MKSRWLLALTLSIVAVPAHAERLQFDHRLYPPLKAVLDGDDKDMVQFDSSKAGRIVDLIAVKGKSARDWTEALEIVAAVPPRDIASAHAWMEAIRARSDALCPNTVTIIAEDAISVTFERKSPGCKAERAQTAVYRLIAGKRSWFQLIVFAKGGLDDSARRQWLDLLASAHLD